MQRLFSALALSLATGCATTPSAQNAAPPEPETTALICVTVKLEGLPPDDQIACLIDGKPFAEFNPTMRVFGIVPYSCASVPPWRNYVFSIGIRDEKGWKFTSTTLANVQPGSVHPFLVGSQKEPVKDSTPSPDTPPRLNSR